MKRINFVASEKHFFNHMLPIYTAMKGDASFYVDAEILDYAKGFCKAAVPFFDDAVLFQKLAAKPGEFVAVASWGDLRRTNPTGLKQVYMEHGAGQTYVGTDCPSYANGEGNKGNVLLYLCPNKRTAEIHLLKNPHIPVKVVGSPTLDPWYGYKITRKKNTKHVVALSFHWDCTITRETRGAFEFFKSAIPALAKKYKLLGHGHPRIMQKLSKFYKENGIEVVDNFSEVMRRAEVYIVDNSSTLFEFAATDRPVVVLNAPWYRRDVDHGLRFWECAKIGVNCDAPKDLVKCVGLALEDSPEQKIARANALGLVYDVIDGKAAERAASAIREVLSVEDCEPVVYLCELNPQLEIYNLRVHFKDGRYRTRSAKVIEALDAAIKAGELPIRRKDAPPVEEGS